MSQIVAIGEIERLRGFGLVGVDLVAAEEPAGVRAAWGALSEDVGLAILTRAAHAVLTTDELARSGPELWVVLAQ
jgi:vacuolar-type H+-ATPase subunit F/Vma7